MQSFLQQPKYTHASIEYVWWIRVFIEKKVREYFLQWVDEATCEFLRFVSEPNAHKESRAYQQARTQILRIHMNETPDNIFHQPQMEILFSYYCELFKGISSEMSEEELSEFVQLDPHAMLPIEHYLQCVIRNNAMDFDNELYVDMMPYFEYLAKRSGPFTNMSLSPFDHIRQIKTAEDLEIYALYFIREWDSPDVYRSSPEKKRGENMAI